MLSDEEGTTVWLTLHKSQPWLTRSRGEVGGCWAFRETVSRAEQATRAGDGGVRIGLMRIVESERQIEGNGSMDPCKRCSVR